MPILEVPIHLQDTDSSCGPACVQMIARSFGAPLRKQEILAQLAKDITAFAQWDTSPDQICEMLNNAERPGGAPKERYRVFCETSLKEVRQRAAASIDAGLPAVALVDEGKHWVVIRGYTTGVHLRNPAPDRTSLYLGTPPQHKDGDDGCETFNEASGGGRGTSVDEYYTWLGWRRLCLKPCGFNRPVKWLNQFIVVAADVAAPPELVDLVAKPKVKARGRQDPARLAIDGLEASGLSHEPGWKEILGGAPSARGTLLVREAGGRSYHLVGLEGARGNVLAGVDARSGELLWAKLNPTMKLLESLFAALPAPGDPKMTTEVIWTPARETFFSPFFPLVRFSDKLTPPAQATYLRLFDRLRFTEPLSEPFSRFE